MENGMIHIYCGDGKGKTTAAIGALVRMAGGGGRGAFFQFLKDNASGERKALSSVDGIDVISGYDGLGKVWTFTEEQVREMFVYYEDKFKEIIKIAADYDMLVLDEVIDAVNYGYLRRETLLDFLRRKPKGLEVILTGRNPISELTDLADYITEMKKIRHPYDKGTKARRLVEF